MSRATNFLLAGALSCTAFALPAHASRCITWTNGGSHMQFRNSCANADIHYRYCVIGSRGRCNHSRGYWGGSLLYTGRTAPGPSIDCVIEVYEVDGRYSTEKVQAQFAQIRSASCP